LGYLENDRHFLNDHTVPIYPTQGFLRRCILEGFQIGSFITTLSSFNILMVISITAYIMKKSNPFHKEPPRAKCSKEWEERISGERFSSRAE
jgi:lysosomal acid lipase/cholesteryl ester hydrolase